MEVEPNSLQIQRDGCNSMQCPRGTGTSANKLRGVKVSDVCLIVHSVPVFK